MASNVKDLFKAAMALDSKVDAAEKALREAIEARSNAVKALNAAHGSGPYSVKGKLFTIRNRPERNEAKQIVGEGTWFFVSVGEKAVTTID